MVKQLREADQVLLPKEGLQKVVLLLIEADQVRCQKADPQQINLMHPKESLRMHREVKAGLSIEIQIPIKSAKQIQTLPVHPQKEAEDNKNFWLVS